MNTIRILFKSFFSPLYVMKIEKVEDRLTASVKLVIFNILLGSIIMPIIYYINLKNKYEISLEYEKIAIIFCMSILTFIIACLSFSLVSWIFNKNISLKEIIATWGLSYIPNVICIVLYWIIQLFNIVISSSIIGFILNTIFIMLLVWKVIFYFIELNFVIKLDGIELLISIIITCIIFLITMFIGFSIGIQVPML